MTIRLVTLVGAHVEILPFMLEHYRAAGVASFAVHVHVPHEADPVRDDVAAITRAFGCGIASVVVGDWRTFVLDTWLASMRAHPDDWWILADQDELHLFPDQLERLLAYCDRRGYDHIIGGFVDRLAEDGGFPAVDPEQPIWSQFPLGGLLTARILQGNSLKVVAAKGRVAISAGHHEAMSGAGCPMRELFIQVHHFKWTAGIVERQRQRAAAFRARGLPYWVESARFAEYCARHDERIDVHDRRLLIAPCQPAYPHWQTYARQVARFSQAFATRRSMG